MHGNALLIYRYPTHFRICNPKAAEGSGCIYTDDRSPLTIKRLYCVKNKLRG